MQYKRYSHEDENLSPQISYGRQQVAKQHRKSRSNHSRTRTPSGSVVNGIHRRRNKRWAW
jgi:hypothetical protein